MKKIVYLVCMLLCIGYAAAATQSHPANQVKAGSFQSGSYNFPGEICLQNDCISSWPAGGGGGYWSQSGSNIYYNSGQVGIGTSDPDSALLHIHDTGVAKSYVHITNKNSGTGSQDGLDVGIGASKGVLWLRENMPLSFATNNQERMVITKEGNVGVGTTTPQNKLDVIGGRILVKGTSTSSSGGMFVQTEGQSKYGFVGLNEQSNIGFWGSGSGWGLVMKTDSGNVGIGTNNPTAKLSVIVDNPDIANTAIQGVSETGWGVNGASKSAAGVYGGSESGSGVRGGSESGAGVYGHSESGPGVYGYSNTGWGLRCDGAQCGGNQQWTVSSDARLKKNVDTVTDALDKVMQLRGVTFEWKNENYEGRNLGFIAQEVLPVVPEVVSKDTEGYYTIKDSALTALLVEAVKEQQAQIEELKARIAELEK
ncbi:tail fiber domain-containing protein [Candidatus Woesearchaeota archaeon]|nr:tail fiber domain-containing protein [Candidatus Woesearchaeota archaeon]